MSWTTPRDWTTGEVVTAAYMNAHVRDNLRYLKGLDGAATFESDLTVDNLITAGNVDGVDVGDHAANTTTAHGAVSAATASKIVVRDGEGQAAFAAPGAAGDALIKGTRVTTAELPAMTDEYIWKGTGANVEEVAMPAPTKEFFVPVYVGIDLTGWYGALIDGGVDAAFIMLIVPQDFTALTSLEVIFQPLETGASMNLAFETRYGAYNGGETALVHQEVEAPRDIGATVNNNNLAHSIADLVDVAALVAGDLLMVQVLYNAVAVDSNAYVKGIRLRYT